ncbi:MAG: Cache 3/Cache 2 fusion domain-containing protein, partial [Bacteroidales bacterium]|nr:Cache 3/Cache 2 fusion domain-containing protein [Bacteroidales bacterium]
MNDHIKPFIIKSRIFVPVGIAITLSILIITIQSIHNTKESIYNSLEKSLTLEVETITKMFEREKSLKLEKVKTHLKFAHDCFYNSKLKVVNDSSKIEAVNQLTGATHSVWIQHWQHNGKLLNKDYDFVDKIKSLTGGTATIFQKIDSGYIRISTNVAMLDSSRAINTFIPNNSPVINAIENDSNFFGRAYVVNDWYITAYEPIKLDGKMAGILYVGNKEKDLPELRKILGNIKIGKSGRIIVIDQVGKIVIGEEPCNESWLNTESIKTIVENKNGTIKYTNNKRINDRIIAYDYYKDFDLFVLAIVKPDEETKDLVQNTIIQSVIYGIIIFILLSLFVFFITTNKLHKYLKQIEDSNNKLLTIREALEHSENKFKTLFNSSSDEIFVADFQGNFVEINQVACDSLEYSKEDLLKMKFFDIKTKKYKQYVWENIRTIIKNGYHTYETEHVSRTGRIIPFEMKSRIIEYDG